MMLFFFIALVYACGAIELSCSERGTMFFPKATDCADITIWVNVDGNVMICKHQNQKI